MKQQSFNIRFCTWNDVRKVEELSKKILTDLAKGNKSDFFGGVDENEIASAMMSPSAVIVAEDNHKNIIGFLVLQKPNKDEEETYAKAFPWLYQKGKSLIVSGFAVDRSKRNGGVATQMLEFGMNFAKENGVTQYIGTVHPKNVKSQKALSHISEVNTSKPFWHETKEGRRLLQQYFLIELE